MIYNRISRTLLPILAMMLLLVTAACRERPVNGRLDGQWRIETVTVEGEEQIPDEASFYCIQQTLLQIVRDTQIKGTAAMTYDREARMLSAEFPAKTFDIFRPSLCLCGICSNPVTFSIEILDSRDLVLHDAANDVTVTLTRF